jgi:hypothetical protein
VSGFANPGTLAQSQPKREPRTADSCTGRDESDHTGSKKPRLSRTISLRIGAASGVRSSSQLRL